MTELGISERRACRALGQLRSTQRKIPTTPGDEAALTADIIELTRQYGRYGYRRITALLRSAGWTVNKKRVERIWRCEGLKVPAKQPKRGRLWLNDGSCIRLRPERPNCAVFGSAPSDRHVSTMHQLDSTRHYRNEDAAIQIERQRDPYGSPHLTSLPPC